MLDPLGNATRAEVAAMLMRFNEAYNPTTPDADAPETDAPETDAPETTTPETTTDNATDATK